MYLKTKKWFNEQTMALSANRRQNTHTAALECCCCKLEKRVEVFLLLDAKYFCKKYILASYIQGNLDHADFPLCVLFLIKMNVKYQSISV